MLNKELHKVQSLEFRVQTGFVNLTSAFGMQRHPELDSGSCAVWQFETTGALTEYDSTSPQKPFAYEAYLTYKRVQLASSPTQLSSILPLGGDSGYPGEGGVSSANRATVFRTNNLNASILIDLRYPNQPQTERINFNKKRIDKQIILKKCQSTNIKNKFCDLDADILLKQTRSNLAPARQEHEFLPPEKGECPDRSVGRGGSFSIQSSFGKQNRINLKINIMKKQFLFLILFVAAIVAGTTGAFAQLTPVPYQTVPEPTSPAVINCITPIPLSTSCDTSGALNPTQGVPYTYTVTTANATDDVRWFVVNNADLKNSSLPLSAPAVDSLISMTNGVIPVGSDYIDPGDGSGDYILSVTDLATNYDIAPNDGDATGTATSIEIAWKYFDGYLPNEVLLVAYVEDDAGCTNNIGVFRIIPQPAFTIDIAVLGDAGDSIAPAESTTDIAEECVSPIEHATYNGAATTPGDLLTVDYGENWVFFVVNGANYLDSWQPSFQLSWTDGAGGAAYPTAEASWAYYNDATNDDPTVWNTLTGALGAADGTPADYVSSAPVIAGADWASIDGGTSAVGNGVVSAAGGECIIVRVRLDWGTDIEHDQANGTLRFAANGISYDGDDSAGTGGGSFFNDDVNFGDKHYADCTVDNFLHDWADYIITARPQVEEGTPDQEDKTGQGVN